MLKFFCLTLVLTSFAFAQTSVTPAGTGTSANPYQIDSLPNLYWLSQTSSAWDDTLIQTADIEASGTRSWDDRAGFLPIGNSSTKFTGSYNGKGHAIRNLTINRPSTDFVGLFGYFGHGAVVDSLGVRQAIITGQNYTGILAGFNAGTIQHSNTSGMVTGGISTGGLVGSDSAATVTLSYSTAVVSGTINVGGLVGDNVGKGVISQSYATGRVTGGTGASDYSAGGLVGFNATDDTIRNCYARGNVSGTTVVGGLVGSNYGEVDKSYSTGTVTVMSANGSRGGLSSYIGGNGGVTASFWDIEASGIQSSMGGMGLTSTIEMQMTVTFTSLSWDFTSTWAIVAGVNGGYPLLQALAYAPVVSTQAVSGVTAHGELSNLGSSEVTSHGFCWSTTGTPTIDSSKVELGATSSIGSFTGVLTGLSVDTTYSVRAYATNASGTSYGSTVSFAIMPKVTTSVSGIQLIQAVNSGTVSYLGTSDVTSHGFCWSTTGTPTIDSNHVDLGAMSVTGTFTDTLKGLSANTAYSVRAYATNASGTSYGSTVSFTTLPVLQGSGTEGDPYLVATFQELKAVGVGTNSRSGVYRMIADIDAVNTDDIVIDTFSGAFHGEGHSITWPSGYVSAIFIRILASGKVDGLNINVAEGEAMATSGGILAHSNAGTIENCHVRISSSYISWSSTSDGYNNYVYFGALVDWNSGVIRGSSVTASGDRGIYGAELIIRSTLKIGGIARQNSGKIVKSYVDALITSGTAAITIGGIASSNTELGVIDSCFARITFNVAFPPSDWNLNRVGGIVGENHGSIMNSYAVIADFGNAPYSDYKLPTMKYFNYVGGIAAENHGAISKCYAVIKSFSEKSGKVDSLFLRHGLVGRSYSTANNFHVDSSYWYSPVLTDACDSVIYCSSVTALDSAQMYQSSNFKNFNFDSVWTQYNGHTYPLLRTFMDTLTVTAKDTTKRYDGTAFSGGNGLKYSLSSVTDSLILGTPSYSGSSQGAINAGSYGIHADSGLWSTQLGYRIGYSADIGALTINPRALSVTGLAAQNKVYDGTTAATLTGTAALDSVVLGEDATLAGTATGTFADKNVGTAKTVTVTGLSLSGAATGNYTLAQASGLTARITPYPITVSADAKSIQQGDADVALTYTATDLLLGDTWSGSLTREVGNIAGIYEILQGTLSAGGNYSITFKGADYIIADKSVVIDPIVPQLAFTGRATARIYNVQGTQVWVGVLDVVNGRFFMPNVDAGRWVVKLQMGNTTKTINAIVR